MRVQLQTLVKTIAFFICLGGSISGFGQTLTISTATSSGSGWSISGGTLTVTANSTVNVTDLTNAMNSGSLTIVGNTTTFTVNINNAITSTTAGSGLTIGSSGNTGTVTVGANLSINGPITIDGGSIVLGGTLTSSQSSAAVTLRSLTHITNTSATTVTTQGGDVLFASNVDDATDAESTTNGYIRLASGITITTSGGNITLGGGDATAGSYALGSSTASRHEGIRVEGTLNLNSGGGNTILRGQSYNIVTASDAWGVGFWALTTGTINSGAGTVLLDGFSQSGGGTRSSGLFSNGNLSITSANTTANAIKFIGKSTGTSGESWGIEAESGLSLIATGEGGGITMSSSQQNTGSNHDVVLRGETNILAKSGPIYLLGGQSGGIAAGYLWLSGNYYIGSKASSAVTASSSNITLQYDNYSWAGGSRYIATSGTVDWKSTSASFSINVNTNWFNWNQNGQTMSGLTIGKPGNTNYLYHQTNAITVAGPFSFQAGYVGVSANLTSSADGDILLKGILGGYDVEVTSTISKTAGTGTLTMQTHGRVILHDAGRITASGTGVLNVVMWSDFDNDNNDGGVSCIGGITTNGGHVWLGGSSSNGGSYTWNGLTVGDGPSIGSNGYNANAMDIWGDVSTNGGDFLAWAGAGFSGWNGIAVHGYLETISVGTGDIILITDVLGVTDGGGGAATYFRQNGGTFTLVPHDGSFAATFNWDAGVESILGGTNNGWNFGGNWNYMGIENVNKLKSLTIGRYDGMSSGGVPVVMTNSSNITVSQAIPTEGSLSLYGGTITLNADLSSSASGDISLYSDNLLSVASARTITTSGAFKYIPQSTSFSTTVSFPITNLTLTNITGVQLGKSGNTSGITIGTAASVNGYVTIYGGAVALNENLSSTGAGNIRLYANTLTFGSGKTVSSTGELLVAPSTVGNTIGVAGSTGSLLIPDGYFTTNFANGFSNITIGSPEQSGDIVTRQVTLQSNLSFLTTGTLTLENTSFDIGSYDVTLGSAMTIAGVPNLYMKTSSTGVVKRTISSSGSLIFPVGNSSYNPVTIANNTGASDIFSARIGDAVLLSGTSGTAITDKVVNRTWHIGKTNANAGSGVDMTFTWDAGEELGTLADYKLSHYGTGWSFATGSSGSVSGTTTKTMTHTGYTGTFSPFAIGSSTGTLPVSWIDFTATRKGQVVELNWRTASEQNTKDFVVQHSNGNGSWKNIGNVAAAGNSNGERAYRFTHSQPVDGRNLYRLVQRDLDGKESISKVVSISMPSATSVQVYPVPSADGKVYVKLPSDQVLKLYSSSGVLMLELQGRAGVQMLELQTLQKGMYYLQAGKETVRVLLQ